MGGAQKMSETIVLVFPRSGITLDELADSLRTVGTVAVHEKGLTLSHDSDNCFVVRVDDLETDGIFEDWETSTIPGQCTVFSVDYRSTTLVTSLVKAIARRREVTVDTNNGLIADGSALVPEMLA